MNYAAIRNYDIANGEGVRTSLFVSGCTNHCPGCFNPEAQDFEYGKLFTSDTLFELSTMLKEPTVSGLSILGGDPMCQNPHGIFYLNELCKITKCMDKTVWLWTGFLWEDLFNNNHYSNISIMKQELLMRCDVVIDGPFIEAQADRALNWRGSANQRVIDVQKTIKQGKIILYEKQ